MTDQHDNPQPGTADDSGPGRRRPHVDHVADELAALRRDVGQQGGLLAELAPRVDDIHGTVGDLTVLVRRLIDAKDDEDREDQAEQDARRNTGLLDEPPSPWCWPVLDRPTATAAWDALDRWAEHVLVDQHQLPLERLPSCWPAHPAAVAELTALRAAHVAAHQRGAHPAAALNWARELPAALDRVTAPIDPEQCPPGRHLVTDPEQRPSERERKRVAATPCSPEAWRPLLEQAVVADVAQRREPPASPAAPQCRDQ